VAPVRGAMPGPRVRDVIGWQNIELISDRPFETMLAEAQAAQGGDTRTASSSPPSWRSADENAFEEIIGRCEEVGVVVRRPQDLPCLPLFLRPGPRALCSSLLPPSLCTFAHAPALPLFPLPLSPQDAFEVNFSCAPRACPSGAWAWPWAQDCELLGEVCGWISAASTLPVWAKMTPNITDITQVRYHTSTVLCWIVLY